MSRIPFDEDLQLYAMLLLRYRQTRSQYDLALVVLQRRTCELRAQLQRRAGAIAAWQSRIDRVESDREIAEGYASLLKPGTALSMRYPSYRSAGLLP